MKGQSKRKPTRLDKRRPICYRMQYITHCHIEAYGKRVTRGGIVGLERHSECRIIHRGTFLSFITENALMC